MIAESMTKAGCISPFLPLNNSKNYPVCSDEFSGKVANDIYTQYVFKQTYTKDSKVIHHDELFYEQEILDSETMH